VTGQARSLPEAVELTAYRVIQESLTNTRKHAGCDTAVVRLGYAPWALRLAVEDEGNALTQESRRLPEGHGIVGMRERVAAPGRTAVGGAKARGRLPRLRRASAASGRDRGLVTGTAPARPGSAHWGTSSACCREGLFDAGFRGH
jgi:signal transduction histidine kinase